MNTEPTAPPHPADRLSNREEARRAAKEAFEACARACTVCADFCIAEDSQSGALRQCVRANLDCADICLTAAHLLGRESDSLAEILRQQVHAAIVACQLCADENERHPHEPCRVAADRCRQTQEAANRLMGEISAAGTIPADPLAS